MAVDGWFKITHPLVIKHGKSLENNTAFRVGIFPWKHLHWLRGYFHLPWSCKVSPEAMTKTCCGRHRFGQEERLLSVLQDKERHSCRVEDIGTAWILSGFVWSGTIRIHKVPQNPMIYDDLCRCFSICLRTILGCTFSDPWVMGSKSRRARGIEEEADVDLTFSATHYGITVDLNWIGTFMKLTWDWCSISLTLKEA